MRITSWNINSVRLRLGLLEKLVAEYQPDIICLQETKVHDDSFPLEGIRDLGFEHVYFSSEKSYNGVAIISKYELNNIQKIKFAGNEDCRHISGELACGTKIHNFYVPAGGDEPDVTINPKFAHKLRFMEEISEYLARHKDQRLIIMGDINIAPLEHDVWSHKQLLKVVSHTPIEVEKMAALKASAHFIDTHRKFVSDKEKLYSWWSYRNKDWEKSNRGRRLDHIWVTPHLDTKLKNAFIGKEVRNWPKPSDHVPIFLDIDL